MFRNRSLWKRKGWLLLSLSPLVAICSAKAGGGERPGVALRDQEVAKVGDTKADWKVKQALKAGLQGDRSARAAGLHEALAMEPNHRLAHWHLGEIQLGGQWVPVKQAEESFAYDNRLSQYQAMRQSIDNVADIAKLARWCERQGMAEEAETHWQAVLNHSDATDKQRDESRRALKLTWRDGRWWTVEEQEAAAQRDADLAEANRTWRPKLRGWQKMVRGRSTDQRALAIRRMREMKDVAAIPLLEEMFLNDSETTARAAIEVLAAWPQGESSRALARQAIGSPWDAIREQASVELERRPLHDFVPLLLDQLSAPLQSQFRIARSNDGVIVHDHQVTRVGDEQNQVLQGRAVAAPLVGTAQPTATSSAEVAAQTHQTNLDNAIAAEQRELLGTVLQAQQIEQQVARTNAESQQHNERFFALLKRVTKVELSDDANAWWDWWRDYNDRNLPERSTQTQTVMQYREYLIPYDQPAGDAPGIVPSIWSGRDRLLRPNVRCECFAAGTLVRTQQGLRPIESIEPGDRVLSQDVETGELAYQCVRGVTVRNNATMCELSIDGESITTTIGHPFWVENVGWRMARHLHANDLLHGLDGPRTLVSSQPSFQTTAYNLVVDDFHSYFVGQQSILVHDNEERVSALTSTPGLLRDPGASLVATDSSKSDTSRTRVVESAE